jgi:hypothetical protein
MLRNNSHEYMLLDGMPLVLTVSGAWIYTLTGQKWEKADPAENLQDARMPAHGMSPTMFQEIFGPLPELPN